ELDVADCVVFRVRMRKPIAEIAPDRAVVAVTRDAGRVFGPKGSDDAFRSAGGKRHEEPDGLRPNKPAGDRRASSRADDFDASSQASSPSPPDGSTISHLRS